MKNTNFIEQVKCMLKTDCDGDTTSEVEIMEEETSAENIVEGFHPFDIDDVFAN